MNSPGPVHGLTAENILATFPIALQGDPSSVALAKVTARLLARRPEEIDRLLIYPAIDRLDEPLLDILAYDFKIDWWDPNYSIAAKRRTLKENWRVHKTFGTKAATERAVAAVYPNSTVEEWFDYGGEPHHFRVTVEDEDTAGFTGGMEKVFRLVAMVKRLSSWLDEIVLEINPPPFVERPGHLLFRRFTMASAFSNLRGGYRLNGAITLDKDDILLDQDGAGISFRRFKISPVRFSHFDSGIRLDGSVNLDGSINLDQAYGVIGLPRLRISSGFLEPKGRVYALSFNSTVRFDNRSEAELPCFSMAAAFRESPQGLNGKLTMDNWRALDGSFKLDGTCTLNAYIKEEEL